MCSKTFWQDFGTILLRSQKAYIWLRWDPWRPNLRSHLEPQKYYTKLVTDLFLSLNVKIHPVSLSAFKLSAPSHCGYKCHVQTMLKDPLLLTFKIHCFWHLHCRTMKWIFFDNVCKHTLPPSKSPTAATFQQQNDSSEIETLFYSIFPNSLVCLVRQQIENKMAEHHSSFPN